MWGNANPTDLLPTWADALAGYDGDDLRDALDAMLRSCREYPPTLPEFMALCREARNRRLQITAALPPPRTTMPEDIRRRLRAFTEKVKAA